MIIDQLDRAVTTEAPPRIETFRYDNTSVRNFAVATAVWGIVAFLVGLIVALKLIFPATPSSSASTTRCSGCAWRGCTAIASAPSTSGDGS